MSEEIPKITVDFEKFKKVYKAAKQAKVKEVSFEYVVGSLFPNIIDNIKEEIRHQHALGYAEGLKEGQTNEE
jgi:tRNA U54 and U55 pseudouridine synthase Pus10